MLDQEHAFPECIDAAVSELRSGPTKSNLFLETGDAFAIDAKDGKELVPEALRLGTL
nr:hypothetical protein [Tepidiphilus baoligensis]